MPTYEYRCAKCGEFEHFQKITDDPLKECPECGSEVSRLISTNAGIIFKGSGFYQTDYKPQPKCPATEKGDTSCDSDTSACPCAE